MNSFAWFIAFMVLIIIEFLTVNLVTIWFVIGSLAALVASYFTNSLIIQIIVFIIFSIITLFFTRTIMRNFKGISAIPSDPEKIIGKVGTVVKRISKENYGEVKVHGGLWVACSNDSIEVGEKVKVIGLDDHKLTVIKNKN